MTRKEKIAKLAKALELPRRPEVLDEVEKCLGKFANGYTQMIRQYVKEGEGTCGNIQD